MPINIENNQITVLSPATLEEVGKVTISTHQDVQNALETAQEYKEWSSLSLKKRCAAINQFKKAVLKNKDLVQEKIKDETGKKDFVILAEFIGFLDHAKVMSKIAKTALRKNKRKAGNSRGKAGEKTSPKNRSLS